MRDEPLPHAATGTERAARPALLVEGLEVRRGDVVIVAGFTWRHEVGKVAWLVGPNGGGKTSLMRVLAGLEAPAAGRVAWLPSGVMLLDSPSTERQRPRDDRRVGYYSPGMSLPRESMAIAFAQLADKLVPAPRPLLPNRDLRGTRCGSLSTGEEKRLLLGSILARGRDFLLLDEPYEHLSREARCELGHELARLARQSVVVIATNQDLPEGVDGPVLRLSGKEVLL